MKEIIGIIGGMGAFAGAGLFEQMLKNCPAKKDQEYCEIIVHNNSRIPDRTEAMLGDGESPLPELLRSAKLLEQCGATKILLACITAHYYYEELQKELKSAKIIHIVNELTEYVSRHYKEIKEIGIISSSGTVKTGIWDLAFYNSGLKLHYLNESEQEKYFNQVIYGENSIKSGNLNSENQNKIQKAINCLRQKGAEIVIGGCSELPLVVSDGSFDYYIDPFLVVIKKITEEYYG